MQVLLADVDPPDAAHDLELIEPRSTLRTAATETIETRLPVPRGSPISLRQGHRPVHNQRPGPKAPANPPCGEKYGLGCRLALLAYLSVLLVSDRLIDDSAAYLAEIRLARLLGHVLIMTLGVPRSIGVRGNGMGPR